MSASEKQAKLDAVGADEAERERAAAPPQYLYTVYQGKIHRAAVDRITERKIWLFGHELAFGCTKTVDRNVAYFTPERAIEAERERLQARVEHHENAAAEARRQIAWLAHRLPNAWEP